MTEAPPKVRYKLVAGQFYDRNPVQNKNPHDPGNHIKFTKGDIVESDRHLDIIFPNAFEKIPDGVTLPPAVTSERKAQVAAMISHQGWQEEDRVFLENLPEQDLQRILRMRPAQTLSSEQEKKKLSPLGDDVTDLFQIAYDEGFKVYRNPTGKHCVVAPNSPSGSKPISLKPLEANEVEKFVKNYLKESKQ